MGFIEKRNGKYRARYRDPVGAQRCRTFTHKADAERFVRDMEVDIERGAWIDPRGADMALADWAEEFMALARRLAPSTQQTYRRDLDRYVLPRCGPYRIGVCRPTRSRTGSTTRSRRGSRRRRSTATTGPCAGCSRWRSRSSGSPLLVRPGPGAPRRQTRDGGPLVGPGRRPGGVHQPAVPSPHLPGCRLGMRWGELIGLRRARLDLRNRKVRVTEQLIRLDGGEWVRKTPKTPSSIRSITISPATAAILAGHLEAYVAGGPDGLVFPNRAGNPLASASFWNDHFSAVLRAAGLSCRFHDLRHTGVALAIAEGADPKAIQTRMGHSSINVTLDRYGHLFPELDEAIATSFGDRLTAALAQRGAGVVVHAAFGAG